jgi:hypothetical protein
MTTAPQWAQLILRKTEVTMAEGVSWPKLKAKSTKPPADLPTDMNATMQLSPLVGLRCTTFRRRERRVRAAEKAQDSPR